MTVCLDCLCPFSYPLPLGHRCLVHSGGACVCMCVCMCVCARMYVYVCVCAHMHVRVGVCTLAYGCVHLCVRFSVEIPSRPRIGFFNWHFLKNLDTFFKCLSESLCTHRTFFEHTHGRPAKINDIAVPRDQTCFPFCLHSPPQSFILSFFPLSSVVLLLSFFPSSFFSFLFFPFPSFSFFPSFFFFFPSLFFFFFFFGLILHFSFLPSLHSFCLSRDSSQGLWFSKLFFSSNLLGF